MGDRHDYVALEWVKGEIAETLKVAHQAIETLLDDPQATHALSECLAYIHQVHGSLQMVEFYGAALLAEEMEQLATALQQNRVSHRDEALHLLLQALGQLPIYLDRVQGARRDLPLVVLPLLNDLRSARGESLLSETSLFSPQLLDLPPLDEESLALLEPADFPMCCANCGRCCKWRWSGCCANRMTRPTSIIWPRFFHASKGCAATRR